MCNCKEKLVGKDCGVVGLCNNVDCWSCGSCYLCQSGHTVDQKIFSSHSGEVSASTNYGQLDVRLVALIAELTEFYNSINSDDRDKVLVSLFPDRIGGIDEVSVIINYNFKE